MDMAAIRYGERAWHISTRNIRSRLTMNQAAAVDFPCANSPARKKNRRFVAGGFGTVGWIEWPALIEEPDEFLTAAGLLQFADGLGFDLPDAFSRHFENVTDFFQRIAVAIPQTVTQLDDFAFAVAERF